MTKEKTALTQLIEKKRAKLDSLLGNPYPSVKVKVQINCNRYDIQMLEKMLPIEKQQIVDAWGDGNSNPLMASKKMAAEAYIQNKFEQ